MWVGLSFILMLCCSVAATAQTVNVDRIQIKIYGIYEGNISKTEQTPTGIALDIVANHQLVKQTTTVPARLGLRFDFEYLVVGTPQDAEVPLKFVTIFPKQGVRPPKANGPVYRNESARTKRVGRESYRDYGFDDEWELVPGTWTIQIWYQERKLAEKSFTVVKP